MSHLTTHTLRPDFNSFYISAQFRSHLRVQQTLEDLQSDKDKDVRNQALALSLDAPIECTNSVINE